MRDFFGFDYYHRSDMGERLNLIAAAEAHVLWKTRLGHHVNGSVREPLESALVGQDGVCQLGNWINGAAFMPFRDMDAYKELNDAHRQFHDLGVEIVAKLKAGDRCGAESLFKHEYSAALRRIIQSLTEINKQLREY
ncbi:MAG TPA: CZB domain-containing protein [Gallionella sp.]|nr:CZB domain-containing protein [Gallionella sp.]